MDEYYPIIVEGDWGPEHAKSVKNKLQIHFQSKKKSQGGDCVVKYDERKSATILFKTSDIRDAVLSQTEHVITIDTQQIKLKVYKPSNVKENAVSTEQQKDQACANQEPKQSASETELDVKKPEGSNAVVLENIADHMNQDVLTLLVENISGLSDDDFSMEIIPELQAAVVTFKNPSAAEKFLEDSRMHERMKKNNLKTRPLERSTCVRVEDLPADVNKMLLELLFENRCGPVQCIDIIPSEHAAIITFKEEEAKERVMKQQIFINNIPLKIYPYFKSLDMVSYGDNKPHLKLPEPITASLHAAIRAFLFKTGQISSIEDKMSSHFCLINMDKPDVLLSPDPALLKQKGVSRRHIDGWSKNALEAFKKIISDYTTSEWPVSHALWSKVETDVKAVVKDQVYTDMDASKGVLTLAGMSHEIIGLKPIMEKILERAANQLEREKNSVTENIEMSPAMYSLLEQDGLKSAVSPQLRIDYYKNMNRLTVSGLQKESLIFKNWVLEKQINMKQRSLKIDRSVLDFLKSVDCDEMSTDLFLSHRISAVYTIENGDVVVIGSTEQAHAEAEKRLNTVLTSKTLLVEDQSVLQMPEWQDLNKQELFNTSKKRTVSINVLQSDKVIVSGFREPVMEVSDRLEKFIEKHTRIEETVRVKSLATAQFIEDRKSQDWQHLLKSDEIKVSFDPKRPQIKLSGQRMFVQPAVTFFKRLAESLHTDTLTIKKAGAKKYFKEQGKMMLLVLLKDKRFVVLLQEDHMLEEDEDDFTESNFGDFGQASCEVQIPGRVTVTVRKADICTLSVDAVVNAANEDLKHTGGVAFALLQAAGRCLQEYCDLHIKVNGRLSPGDAVITEAGRLPCKYVVHAVGPRFRGSDQRTAVQQCLRRAVRESLNQASRKKCSSIAIPVISSGIFGCPLDLCTESIAKEVRQYIENHNYSGSSSTLTEIQLVDNNDKNVNAMAQAVRNEFAAYNPKMTFPHQSKPHEYSNYEHGHRADSRGHGRENHNQRNHRSHSNREFEEQAHSWSGDRTDQSEGLIVLETKTTQDGLKICLCEGNIQDARADVIVNTISEDMDLRKGAVSKALLHAAGRQLQSEVNRAAKPFRMNTGEIVITDGYNLKCSRVFHVVCPFWRHGSEDRVLSQIIRNCLKNAETQRMNSIVFPAIGTGNLGFPKDLVAKIILTEVQQFNTTNLKMVTVIVHPSDKESVKCFTSIFRHGHRGPITKEAHHHIMPKKSAETSGTLGKVSSLSLGVYTMQLGQVTLEVSSGDITKEKTDAIVNSSNPTFSLKAGVSKAILDAAGGQVEHECSQIASSNKQQREIVTSSGRLPCGKIIHISGCNGLSTIKEVVLSVLKLCESQQFTSIAFPALGTGQGGAEPGDVADAMVDAVVDFVKKKKPVHVKFVKFLIFQANMLTEFHQSMVRRSGEKVEEEKGLFTKFKDYFFGESSESSANEEFVMVGEEIEPAVFQLCGETPQDLTEAKEMIKNFIIQEHLTIPIHDPAIAHFTREDVEMLNGMQKELTVSVKLEKKGQDSVVTMEGLTRDVHTAESRVRDMIRKVERNESRKREALMIRTIIKWQYQEYGQRFENFDMLTNYDLEQAFQNRQPSVRIKINNDEYEADLVRKVANRRGIRIQLNRVDLEDAAKSGSQSSLPSHWENMKGKSVILVKLKAGSKEYTEVEKEFRRTGLTFKIIEIERVQNSALWRSYMIKMNELEDKNQHKNNEKRLFHGTGPDTTDQINNHGFNRSYAGMHGAMFGKGSYFAVDPSYSAQGYSKPDAKGHKRMYLAKVLVGDFTRGNPGLIVPPAKSTSSADLYNSVTNDVNNPTMFVIFHDVQAYPEYLITFQ
ncbi:protein mono-ADP-ribosyltransferase PARP14 isoform X2 [Danio aesculapii]|uniref:protein mono-ADP-ribosyltransferase PARP14 isoform X2 n=1 Tax=Danio aesculapii TaxID=1142201 RepID=UPI0024C0C91D|nr:protein mono-ADP-ribosyltransferase PARP14 isoform X2 [Danio aesculapii]